MPSFHDPAPPADVMAALTRLKAEYPASWYEVVADAVVEIGGTDAADLLAMAVDRAETGRSWDGEGDPEQALQNLESDLRT